MTELREQRRLMNEMHERHEETKLATARCRLISIVMMNTIIILCFDQLSCIQDFKDSLVELTEKVTSLEKAKDHVKTKTNTKCPKELSVRETQFMCCN